jgi:hypothetical protein
MNLLMTMTIMARASLLKVSYIGNLHFKTLHFHSVCYSLGHLRFDRLVIPSDIFLIPPTAAHRSVLVFLIVEGTW